MPGKSEMNLKRLRERFVGDETDFIIYDEQGLIVLPVDEEELPSDKKTLKGNS